MNKSKCAWCGSEDLEKIIAPNPTKYQELKCKKCGKISYHQIDFKLINLPPTREFLLLDDYVIMR